MSLLRALARLLGLADRAEEDDERAGRALSEARQAGRTAGEVAAEGERAAVAARARAARCRLCGGTGYLKVHVDDVGARCHCCLGSGEESSDSGPPPSAPAVLVCLVAWAFWVSPAVALGQEPMPPPVWCEPLLAGPDPVDVAGLQRVVTCERLTSAYELDRATRALRLADGKIAALGDPPNRLTWLLCGAAAVASIWTSVALSR